MKLTSMAFFYSFSISVFACGSTTLDRTDDESSLDGSHRAAGSDAGTGTHDGGSRNGEASASNPSPSTNPSPSPTTNPNPSHSGSSTGVRCAPGADCNGIFHCNDSDYEVEGNGTCALDCNCSDSTGSSGTLQCQIWACR